jgi:hypothetical protein
MPIKRNVVPIDRNAVPLRAERYADMPERCADEPMGVEDSECYADAIPSSSPECCANSCSSSML